MYEELINQLCMYAEAIRILLRGYLPISLLPPSKLQEILGKVKKAIWTTNPDYDTVIKILHLYYDMKLVTFGIDKGRNLIIRFPIFVQAYTQQLLILYQIETVPVAIVDLKCIFWSDSKNSEHAKKLDTNFTMKNFL